MQFATRSVGSNHKLPGVESQARLTRRQLEVLNLIGTGLSTHLISRRLDISLATAKSHISSVLRAFKVNNRIQALIAAHRQGVLALAAEASLSMRPRSRRPAHPGRLARSMRTKRIVQTGIVAKTVTAPARRARPARNAPDVPSAPNVPIAPNALTLPPSDRRTRAGKSWRSQPPTTV